MAIKFSQVVDLGNQRIISLASPSLGTDAVNKDYVDNVLQGLDWKLSVRAASTGALTLSGPGATIDGVTMSNGDRFLAKDQADGAENGIYIFNGAAAAATRAPDADSSAEVTPGMAVSIEEGTVNGDRTFNLVTNAPITLGTTALTFSLLNGGANTYLAGAGLTLSGSTFDIGQGTGIIVSADSIGIDTALIPRKYAVNVGNGSATSITITHNLGTRDVVVELYTNGSPWDTVFCEVQRPDVNNVTLIFGSAPASGAYRAVVTG